MGNPSFSFTLFTTNDADDQIRVTVYRAKKTQEQILYNSQQATYKPNHSNAIVLTQMLEPDMLTLPAPNTLVLVKPHLRVDSQPVPQNLIASGVWRNIHIQNGQGNVQKSFSVVKIRQGAQLCYVIGYQYKLLNFLQDGLFNSLNDAMKYIIPVKIERRRKKKKENWTEITLTEEEIKKLKTQIEERLNKKNDLKSKRFELAQNIIKIATATTMITRVVAAIEKNVLKLTGKEGSHIAAKKIPIVSIVSTFVGIFFGAYRAEVASGVLADIPGLGTAASAAIDVGLLAKDIAEAVQNETEQKRLAENEIEDLKRKNQKIKDEIKDFAPESAIFGEGFANSYYDESEIAYIDDISKIHVNSSDLIHGIQIEYRLGGKQPYHGGCGGTLKTMVLDPNEKITTVEVSIYKGVVSSLSFYTDIGNTERFGKVHGDLKAYELADGAYLGAIKGYDMFKNVNGEATKNCPTLPGNREILPGIGFTAKF